jgi:hypothetical protein
VRPRRGLDVVLVGAFALLVPSLASAQAPAPSPSRLWLVAGGTYTALRGDCQTCEDDYPYRHAASLLVNIGRRLTDRMDVGAELFWIPAETASGTIRVTHIDAIAQFRPWVSQGLFLKGGAGLAFTRNWVDAVGPEPFNEKVLSVVIGAGWAFRPASRVGFQIFGTQHVGAIGDLQTAAGDIPDVVGNFWSMGAAIVIR